MTLAEAKEIANKINGPSGPWDYRNVWGFFPLTEGNETVVLVTKDASSAPLSGVFIDDDVHDGLVNYETGEEVDPSLVFGKAFYESNPGLLDDDTDWNLPIAERIDTVVKQIEKLSSERKMPVVTMPLMRGVAEDEKCDQETVLRRLAALKNYLAKIETELSIADVTYLIQELDRLE